MTHREFWQAGKKQGALGLFERHRSKSNIEQNAASNTELFAARLLKAQARFCCNTELFAAWLLFITAVRISCRLTSHPYVCG